MEINSNEKNYPWAPEQEMLIKKWADHALCFRLMHDRAHKKYWCLNAWVSIPIIIISTLTGTGNFISASVNQNNNLFIFILGALNIFSGILATISNYFGIAQNIESHRIISISWDKFNRKIEVELSKIRNDRVNAKDFIHHVTDEYNKLVDMSPILSNDIIRWFIKTIEAGNFDDDFDDFILCIYDCLCFPFGCYLCNCLKCCCKRNKKKLNKFNLRDIDLPEIVGYMKPLIIAKEQTAIDRTRDSISIIAKEQTIDHTRDQISIIIADENDE
jgi:hypothetical protein